MAIEQCGSIPKVFVFLIAKLRARERKQGKIYPYKTISVPT